MSSPYTYTAPPPSLPNFPRRARQVGTSITGVLVLVIVILMGVGVYVYYTKYYKPKSDPGSEHNDPKPKQDPNPELTEEAEKEQMRVCKAKGVQHGTCMLDPGSNTIYARCEAGYYGEGCSRKCVTSNTKAVVYKSGFEAGSPNAATCECEGHFQNSDPQSGCVLGNEAGDHCEADWHGSKCDKKGEYNALPANYCTSKDKTATVVGNKCVCSDGWTGPHCTTKAIDVSKEQVTFIGGSPAEAGNESCGNSHNCTQKVDLCALLQEKEGGVEGCSSITSLCDHGLVESTGDRCSLMEKMATTQHGLGSTYFAQVKVPQNVSFEVSKGKTCSGEKRRPMSECVTDNCSFTSGHYEDDFSFRFKLPPQSVATCGSKTYKGGA